MKWKISHFLSEKVFEDKQVIATSVLYESLLNLVSWASVKLFNENLPLSNQKLPVNYQIADDKTLVCKFSKNVKPKIYHIEISKTRGQTV